MWVYFVMFYLVLGLVFLPVKQAVEIPKGVVSDLFVELAPNFSFAGAIYTPVVHRNLAGLCVAGGLVADVVAFVVNFEQMAQKELNLVLDVLVRHDLLAFFALHATDAVLVRCLEDTGEFKIAATAGVGAVHSEAGNRTIFQLLLSFRLKDSIVQVGVVFGIFVGVSG